MPDATDGEEKVVSDWWDYFPVEQRFVRVHEIPRCEMLSFDDDDADVLFDDAVRRQTISL